MTRRPDDCIRPAVLAVSAFLCVAVWAQEPPRGWREPTPEATGGQTQRADSPTRYIEAEGDFDGDEETDRAVLFMTTDGTREGLFVRLSSADPSEWRLAAETLHSDPSMILRMGISIVDPGSYVTACGKGYWECRPGEPARLELERSGIECFRLESGSSIVYWDRAAGEFVQVWTSD